MKDLLNYLIFHENHTDYYPLVKLSYLDSSEPIQSFIGGDIQYREKNCLDWIKVIQEAEIKENHFYDSFGNCCTTTVTSKGVTIENEYTEEKSENIKLQDMEIILKKWLEHLKTKKTVEYTW
jgi:hypothetical protein